MPQAGWLSPKKVRENQQGAERDAESAQPEAPVPGTDPGGDRGVLVAPCGYRQAAGPGLKQSIRGGILFLWQAMEGGGYG